jgi:ribose transport system permease protein
MRGKLLGIFTVLIVLCATLTLATSDPWWNISSSKFLQPGNIQNLLNRISLFGILGTGVAFVIITGGIDLSIGSAVCLSGVLLSLLLHVEYQPATSYEVERVDAASRTLRLVGSTDAISSGTTIRFAGGIGAGQRFLVESTAAAEGRTVLTVAQDPARSESGGRIVVAVPVASLQPADGKAIVELEGSQSAVPGDQLQLVSADGSVRSQRILSVESSSGGSRLELDRDPGSRFHADVFGVVLKRHQFTSIPVAIGLVLLTGLGLGLIHGLLITRARLQPFVVTLCSLLILRGVSRWLTSDNPAGFGELQQVLGPLASGRVGLAYRGDQMVFGIPIPFFMLSAIGIVAAVFLGRTIWGRYLLALGRSEEAARFSGIHTGRVTMLAYIICTGLAALGGMLFALDSTSVSPSSFGNSYELYAIAAAVLGGCSLRGGEGSILGVVIGTAVMQVLNNLITLLQIPQSLEYTIIGSVILVGVFGDELVRRAAAKRRLRQSVGG